jgi:(heptosyl)LPS beta-1,4-glucosyltransferase
MAVTPTPTLTAVVLARDEAPMIEGCLRRLAFADDVLVALDARTTDDTAAVAVRAGARVESVEPAGFGEMRNRALAHVRTDWVLFVDADERVTAPLAAEITQRVAEPAAAYRIPIANWFYGSRVRRSGYRERPIRLFPLAGVTFAGDIHEQPSLPGGLPVRQLRHPIEHLSHRTIAENLAKTARYADVQAAELLAQGHPPVKRWTLLFVLAKGITKHLVVGQGFRDGTAGFIESIYQPFSHFCVHVRLWELQQRPSIAERYRDLEDQLP